MFFDYWNHHVLPRCSFMPFSEWAANAMCTATCHRRANARKQMRRVAAADAQTECSHRTTPNRTSETILIVHKLFNLIDVSILSVVGVFPDSSASRNKIINFRAKCVMCFNAHFVVSSRVLLFFLFWAVVNQWPWHEVRIHSHPSCRYYCVLLCTHLVFGWLSACKSSEIKFVNKMADDQCWCCDACGAAARKMCECKANEDITRNWMEWFWFWASEMQRWMTMNTVLWIEHCSVTWTESVNWIWINFIRPIQKRTNERFDYWNWNL